MSTIVHVRQGTEAWHQFRLTHNGASEAAAMLGLSKKVKRSELVRMKATGLAREFSDWVQKNVLDYGHEVEARARPIVEEQIGEELYPATYEEGKESASVDGITLGGELAFEHKQWAIDLAESVRQGVVPEEHMPQCQQILMVTGAEKVRFVVSDGTALNMVQADVLPDPAWFQRLHDGWRQFDKDVAAYAPEPDAEPTPIGKAPETLPALRIEVTGAVTASNLAEFKATALDAIRSVNRDLKTDGDFADAAKAVKWCEDVESRIKAAKDHALSQTADIDALFKTLDDIGAEARSVRLDLDKLVKRRKDEVRDQAVMAARRALEDHIGALNAELAPMRLQPVPSDFAAAIKGLRSIASMQDALDTTLANGKIAADGQARLIRKNLTTFKQEAEGFEFLFTDLGSVITKDPDHFQMLVQSRVSTHQAKEAARLEAERDRIRAEESARLEREQKAREEAAAREAAQAQARADAEQLAAAQREADERSNREAAEAHHRNQAAAEAARAEFAARAAATPPAPAPEVRAFTRRAAPAPNEEPEAYTVRLGEIQALIAPYTITAEGIAQEGFQFRVERGMKFYRQSDARALCLKASKHFAAKAEELLQAA